MLNWKRASTAAAVTSSYVPPPKASTINATSVFLWLSGFLMDEVLRDAFAFC